MSRRATSLGVGLMAAVAFVTWAALGEDEPLCINGHPAPRSRHVSYGGLAPRPGFERDHWVPLCLGGADASGNVWYQPIDQARRKDVEERQLCEAYCRGSISLESARQRIMEDWPR